MEPKLFWECLGAKVWNFIHKHGQRRKIPFQKCDKIRSSNPNILTPHFYWVFVTLPIAHTCEKGRSWSVWFGSSYFEKVPYSSIMTKRLTNDLDKIFFAHCRKTNQWKGFCSQLLTKILWRGRVVRNFTGSCCPLEHLKIRFYNGEKHYRNGRSKTKFLYEIAIKSCKIPQKSRWESVFNPTLFSRSGQRAQSWTC